MATFTFETAAPVQAPGPVQTGPAMVGVVGQTPAPRAAYSPGGEFGAAADSSARTIDALVKMGQTLLAPKVQAEKSRMAMEGMVAALQGMAAAQIQDEEIFGGMFGDTVTVAAARQVEQMDAVNKFNIHLAENMHELRQMDTTKFRQWFPQQMQQFMTGDDQSDALITQAFMESAPKVIDMHTKAHIGYRQEVAENAWSNDLNTAAASMAQARQKAGQGQLSFDMAVQAEQQFVARLAGPGGIHGEAYKKWLNKAYRRFAAEGNIVALDLMEQTGVLTATQDDQQYEQLIKIRDRAESKAIAQAPAFSRFVSDLGVVEAGLDGGYSNFTSLEDIDRWAAQYNQMTALETGVSTPVIDNNRLAQYKERWLKGLDKAQGRVSRADELAIKVAQGVAAYKAGNYWQVYKDTELNTSEVKNAVHEVLINEGQWDQIARHAARTEEKWDILDQRLNPLKELLMNGSVAPGLNEGIQLVSDIVANAGTNAEILLGRYLGPDMGAHAMNLLKYAGEGVQDPEKLASMVRDLGWNSYRKPTDFEVKQAHEWALQQDGKGLFNFTSDEFDAVKPTEAGLRVFADEIAPIMAKARAGSGRSLDSVAKLAAGYVGHTMDWVGGFPAISRAPAGEQHKTMNSAFNAKLNAVAQANGFPSVAVGQYSPEYQEAVRLALEAKYKAIEERSGFTFTGMFRSPTVIEGQWLGGVDGIMHLRVERSDGVEEDMQLTVDDVVDSYITMRNRPVVAPTPWIPGGP